MVTDPDALTRVPGVLYRTIAGHLLRMAALTRTTGQTGRARSFQARAAGGRVALDMWPVTPMALARLGSLNFLYAG